MPTQPQDTNPAQNGPQAGAQRLAAWRASGGQPGPRRNPIERLALTPTSLRAAITAKCYDCQGQDADPNWQWRVGNCTAPCPLHNVRPHQQMQGRPMPASLAEHAEATP